MVTCRELGLCGSAQLAEAGDQAPGRRPAARLRASLLGRARTASVSSGSLAGGDEALSCGRRGRRRAVRGSSSGRQTTSPRNFVYKTWMATRERCGKNCVTAKQPRAAGAGPRIPTCSSCWCRCMRQEEAYCPQNRAQALCRVCRYAVDDAKRTPCAAGEGRTVAGKRADLDRPGRALAFAMQEAGERGTAVERQWAVTAATARRAASPMSCSISPPARRWLTPTMATVRFVHQLIQEYFAALAWQQRLPDG